MSVKLYKLIPRAIGKETEKVEFEAMFFPGGECHVKATHPNIKGGFFLIDARISYTEDLMLLLSLTDAIRRQGAQKIELLLPYFPGGRQDRVPQGTYSAFTAKIYADIINSQKYDVVYTVDPHSDVTTALLDRVAVIDHVTYIKEYIKDKQITALICPDAGAEKRTSWVAKQLDLPVIYARKTRDVKSGKLSGFSLDPLPGIGTYLVVDDICDGGGTFLGLAEAFHKDPHSAYNSFIHLWVTHGIFSRGYAELFNCYDSIGSTDSHHNLVKKEGIQVLPIFNNYNDLLERIIR